MDSTGIACHMLESHKGRSFASDKLFNIVVQNLKVPPEFSPPGIQEQVSGEPDASFDGRIEIPADHK